MRQANDAEAIVVGAGHNGLIAAAYLARAGVDTLLVEARSSVGGCASTESMWGARFNICNCDHTMIRAMPVIDELELAHHGLIYLEADTGYISVFHDDSPAWIHFHSVEATLDELAHTYPGAVDGYRRYVRDALPVARLVIDMARSSARAGSMLAAAGRRRGHGAARLLRWSRQSLNGVLGRYFDDWQLLMPATTTGPTVWGVAPDVAGTGLAAALYATRHLVKTGRPRGGSGALPEAVAASFVAAGGRVRCDSRVAKLLVEGERVHGVELAHGGRLRAPTVVVAYDPRRVLLDWVDDVPAAARRLVGRYRREPDQDGYESKIDAVLTGRPRYRAYEPLAARHPDLELMGATTMVNPTPADLAQAHARRGSGTVADRPSMLVNVPSVLDPTVGPPDRHVLSLEALFTPYALPGGWPDSGEPQRWLDLWSSLIEPDSLGVDRWRVMTPDRYEAEFAMHRGHTPSYAGSPLAALIGRRRETTRYRTPITGLYFTGAGTFPGAGVFGASGRNAAHAVLGDRRDRHRRTAA